MTMTPERDAIVLAHLDRVLSELLTKLNSPFGHMIGKTYTIKVDDEGHVVYARRMHGLSP